MVRGFTFQMMSKDGAIGVYEDTEARTWLDTGVDLGEATVSRSYPLPSTIQRIVVRQYNEIPVGPEHLNRVRQEVLRGFEIGCEGRRTARLVFEGSTGFALLRYGNLISILFERVPLWPDQ